MSTISYKIIDGPPAALIWDHAKHSMNMDVNIPVRFTTDRKISIMGPIESGPWLTISPRIISVTHHDDSGTHLFIKGSLGGKPFSGHYNARNRRGIIEVESD